MKKIPLFPNENDYCAVLIGHNRLVPLSYKIINSRLSGELIAASIEEGLYYGLEPGETFTLIRNFPGASYGLRCIFIDRRQNIFVSPDGTNLPPSECGLWSSFDSGKTWEKVLHLPGTGDVMIWGMVEDAAEGLFAGTYTRGKNVTMAQIYRSRDGGRNWEISYDDPPARHIHAIEFDPWQNALYATLGDDFGKWKTKRIIRSLNGGKDWEVILPEMKQVVPVISTPSARVFGSDTPEATHLYRTTDDRNFETVLSEESALYFFWIRRDPENGDLYASGVTATDAERTARVYHSNDDGRSWRIVLELPACAKNDGSSFASNIQQNRLLIQIRYGGKLLPACSLIFPKT